MEESLQRVNQVPILTPFSWSVTLASLWNNRFLNFFSGAPLWRYITPKPSSKNRTTICLPSPCFSAVCRCHARSPQFENPGSRSLLVVVYWMNTIPATESCFLLRCHGLYCTKRSGAHQHPDRQNEHDWTNVSDSQSVQIPPAPDRPTANLHLSATARRTGRVLRRKLLHARPRATRSLETRSFRRKQPRGSQETCWRCWMRTPGGTNRGTCLLANSTPRDAVSWLNSVGWRQLSLWSRLSMRLCYETGSTNPINRSWIINGATNDLVV